MDILAKKLSQLKPNRQLEQTTRSDADPNNQAFNERWRSCEGTECWWPCKYHFHDVNDESALRFKVSEIFAHAKNGCITCFIFRELAEYECRCRQNGHPSRSGRGHDCISLEARIWVERRQIDPVVVKWSCGSLVYRLADCSNGYHPLELGPRMGLFDDVASSKHSYRRSLGSLDERADSDASFSLYREWIRNCNETHHGCAKNVPGLPNSKPRRLLDLRSYHAEAGNISIVDTASEHLQYAALSYCWGGAQPMMTVQNYVGIRSAGIAWVDLPRCFQDAVTITLKLGLQFLWIDSLCIVQDDQNDWEMECSHMGGIFSGSHIVIAAASTTNPSQSFLDTVASRSPYIWRRLTGVHGKDIATRQDPFSSSTRVAEPSRLLENRAWACQERLLARQCLIFESSQTVWECREWTYSEFDPAGFRHNKRDLFHDFKTYWGEDSNDKVPHEPDTYRALHVWHELVPAYSCNYLTRPSDRLPAFSAVAAIVANMSGDEYLAGLWRTALRTQLAWFSLQRDGTPHTPHTAYSAPTWSWASCNRPIFWLPGFWMASNECEVVDAKCEEAGANPFGAVKSGYIILRGITSQAEASLRDGGEVQFTLLDEHSNEVARILGGSDSFGSRLDHPVGEKDIVESATGKSIKILTRASSNTAQAACAGRVNLFWLHDKCFLILAMSMKEESAFERLGILYDHSMDKLPRYLLPLEIEEKAREEVKII